MVNVPATLEQEEITEVPFDAGDPAQVNAARKKAGRLKRKERDDLVSLMETDNGRAFLWRFCCAAVEGDPMVAGDPYSVYFNLGQERKARVLFQELLRVCPKLVAMMVEENMSSK